MRSVIEADTHSPWASRLLEELGHEVIVANPRQLRLIHKSHKKSDPADEALARLGRVDPNLLHPIRHRGAEAQVDLVLIRARDALVKSRTQLVNHVRGAVKSVGRRLPTGSTSTFAKLGEHVPKELWPARSPLLDTIGRLSQDIRRFDQRIERLARKKYPESERLRQVQGIGPITAPSCVLTIEDPGRFQRNRQIGAWLGVTPRQDQSGTVDRQLRITKAGDEFLRRLLVGSAQYILGPFGKDSDLRRWGLKLAERGGKKRQAAGGRGGGPQARRAPARTGDPQGYPPTDRLLRLNWMDPSMHEAAVAAAPTVRMEARRRVGGVDVARRVASSMAPVISQPGIGLLGVGVASNTRAGNHWPHRLNDRGPPRWLGNGTGSGRPFA